MNTSHGNGELLTIPRHAVEFYGEPASRIET